jgi:hypothetical protein
VIDTAIIVWGGQIGTAARRVKAPLSGRRLELLAAPIRLDVDELASRLGDDAGQVTEKRYGEKKWQGGHWTLDDHIELMYRHGRVEARASLPKLLTGRNDVVLNERGVHEALRLLASRVSVALEYPLSLREATASRLDYAIQWDVLSVAAALEHLKRALKTRKMRTENVAASGRGRSVVWGYRSQHALRFYDKIGELAETCELDPAVELDTDMYGPLLEDEDAAVVRDLDRLLRYEVQDKRRDVVRLIHERGYRAVDVRLQLMKPIESVIAKPILDLRALIASEGRLKALAAIALAEHPEFWPEVAKHGHPNTVSRWRAAARRAGATFETWSPAIPPTAFVADGAELWADDDAYDEAA